MSIRPLPVTTVILAGGLGTRIGGDKGLQRLHDKPLISWVLDAVSRDSTAVLINANDAQGAYNHLGCRVIADQLPDWPGPLAGLHVALLSARTAYVMTVPCDTPFLPENLMSRLFETLDSTALEAVVALENGNRQPTIALYRSTVLPKLVAYLAEGKRKVNDWLDTLLLAEVVFDTGANFENINSREDLARAHKIALRTHFDMNLNLPSHSPETS